MGPYGEDRGHAHILAWALSGLCATAVNLIQHLSFRFILDDWRALAARPN